MLLRLRTTQTPAELDPLLDLARGLGYRTRLLDRERRVLELVRLPEEGDGAPQEPDREHAADRSRFEDLAVVEGVLDGADAPELAERAFQPEDTVVEIGEARFGGGHVALVAGPCAVEGEEDLLEVARAVRRSGGTLLRGGAFKPRTSPHSFQGLGLEGLERLRRVKEEVGLAVVTEVLDPRDVPTVAAVADALQIGSRSMSNAALLREAGASGCPVLLKRGLAATVRELLLAAEYLLAEGNQRVVLCERGIRGFDTVTRNLLDVGAVAHLKLATHLPVIVDPSHAAGRPDLVLPLSRAGIAAGADGLIVEVHPRPHAVRSDGAQAIAPEAFARLAESVSALVGLDGRTLSTPSARFEESAP
jgi:3-deoxy-7-phosphoheptulonate synthase